MAKKNSHGLWPGELRNGIKQYYSRVNLDIEIQQATK
jgi:hypothetical protein